MKFLKQAVKLLTWAGYHGELGTFWLGTLEVLAPE
jgi:hypothetical protein